LYAWQQPTLSLGYFQAHENRRRHPASLGCPAVRRLSGGGAILHDAELTYSLVVPRGHALAQDRRDLYRAVHTTLIEVLSQAGIAARLRGESPSPTPGEEPFLCFRRRAAGDVLIGETKIAGSAQRRSSGAVLQHGSVLVARSPAAPELEGLQELTKRPPDQKRLGDTWLEALGDRLRFAWLPQPLSASERDRVAELVEIKYATEAWTLRRGRQGTSLPRVTRS
jgi:lipoate-protein ligase A